MQMDLSSVPAPGRTPTGPGARAPIGDHLDALVHRALATSSSREAAREALGAALDPRREAEARLLWTLGLTAERRDQGHGATRPAHQTERAARARWAADR